MCPQCQGFLVMMRFSNIELPVGQEHMQRWIGCIFCADEFKQFVRACQTREAERLVICRGKPSAPWVR